MFIQCVHCVVYKLKGKIQPCSVAQCLFTTHQCTVQQSVYALTVHSAPLLYKQKTYTNLQSIYSATLLSFQYTIVRQYSNQWLINKQLYNSIECIKIFSFRDKLNNKIILFSSLSLSLSFSKISKLCLSN